LSGGDQRWVKESTKEKRSVAGDKMMMMMMMIIMMVMVTTTTMMMMTMTAMMMSIMLQDFRGKAETDRLEDVAGDRKIILTL
jgi:hypothetical protein